MNVLESRAGRPLRLRPWVLLTGALAVIAVVVVASVAFTAFGNVTGLPAVSLPLYWTDEGVPVGVQLTAGPWQEARLISLSAQLEQARPWAQRSPALSAAA